MEKKMETTIVYIGLHRVEGIENENYYSAYWVISGRWKRKWKLLLKFLLFLPRHLSAWKRSGVFSQPKAPFLGALQISD